MTKINPVLIKVNFINAHTHTELHALSPEPFNEFFVRVAMPDSLTMVRLI
jgi:hypothetical protein